MAVAQHGGRGGSYCLIAVSFGMSIMFPTIFATAIEGLGEDTEIGANPLKLTFRSYKLTFLSLKVTFLSQFGRGMVGV